MPSALRRVALGCAAALVAGIATTGASSAAVAGGGSGTPGQGLGAAPGDGGAPRHAYSVTLITGERVDLAQLLDGRQAASVEPAKGRSAMSFQQIEVDGDLYVIPLDAIPYLAAERIDRALFNVTELIEQQYDDGRRSTIPLIVTYRDDIGAAGLSARAELPGDGGPVLESINGRAVAADKDEALSLWHSVTDGGIGVQSAAATLDAGVDRIWLDGRVEASLDRSVGQVGAPVAWELGYDGRGVTVAVLDTGIDGNHPDLVGKVVASRNFSDSPEVTDRFGHGTHVASIIAGSGAASGGARKGVAPGARLISGKVLNDWGFGQESWILDGMEWAAESGADVVNMSLGGYPTDGTDPMSMALDALTARTGTLFVVSAGNSGEFGEFTVGSPGSAGSALTVGAVDRDDRLAAFSSRGPRLGDFAVKPDITAPGVGIVAARAEGTTMGTPWDANYTAASGTSMAAPHVAGAAAIVAQHRPDFGAGALKDALVSTAVRAEDRTVFEQGGGRLDVARAVTQGIFATGTLDLGVLPATPKGGQVTREVSYVNTTDEPVTLDLAVSLRGPGGTLPADAVRPAHSSIEVAPGAIATVPLIIDSARLRYGRFGGYLTATAGTDIVVHTSLGLLKDAPRHKVTLSGIGSDGRPAFVNPVLLFGEDSRFDFIGYIPGSSRTIEVGEGTYHLHAVVSEGRAPDETHKVIVDPMFTVTGDRDVVLDARQANEVVIKTPKPAVQDGIWSFYSYRAFDTRRISHHFMTFDGARHLYVTPTSPVTDGAFEFGSRWSMVAPILTARVLGRDGFAPELFYLSQSPALDGRRMLPVVDVGNGAPEDYRQVDVEGKAVLVSATDWDYEQRVRDAAAAGATLAIVIVFDGDFAWGKWNPLGDRLPAMGVVVSQRDGERLRGLLGEGSVNLELQGTPVSPYLYDVLQVAHQQVPEQVTHTVNGENSATVVTSYHESGGEPWSKEQRFGWRPWQQTAVNQFQRVVHTPLTRVETVSAGDTIWQHRVKHYLSWDAMNPLWGGMTQGPQQYAPGEHQVEQWFAPVVRPAIAEGVDASVRMGDTAKIRIAEWVDSGDGHYGFPEGDLNHEPDHGTTRLFKDGELIAETEFPWADIPLAPEPATYQLDVSLRRTSPEWMFSTRTDTRWTFESARPEGAQEQLLPLLRLDYDVTTDVNNQAPAGMPLVIGFSARHQQGVDGLPVAGMAAWVSYDDGGTWHEISLTSRSHGRYLATIHHPESAGYVTLRVRAWDIAGNSVDQTVLRAYGLAESA